MNKKLILAMVGLVGIMVVSAIAANNDVDKDIITITNAETSELILESDFRVEELKNNKILIGDEKGDLQLDKTLKRQEMVVLISRLMGKGEEAKNWSTENITFLDVAKDNWAAPYIAWAKDNNITKGYSEEWFGYNDSLTEIQTGIFLLRVLGYSETEMDNASEIGSEVGIISIHEEFLNEEIVRGDVAIMIYNIIYSNTKDSEQTLKEKLNLVSNYTEEERKVALIMQTMQIDFLKMVYEGQWKTIYVNFGENEITKDTIETSLDLYQAIGTEIEYSPYLLIDLEKEKLVKVIFYEEYGVIYQISLNEEIVYEYKD